MENKVVMLDPSQLNVVDGLNLRKEYSSEEYPMEELKASIRESGIIEPLRAYRENNKWYNIKGHRRLQAVTELNEAEKLGIKIPVIEEKKPSKERLIQMMFADSFGKPLTKVEQAEAVRRLVACGHKQVKIAQILSKKQSWVSQQLDIAELPDDVKNLIRGGKVASSEALKIAKAAQGDDDKTSQLAQQVIEQAKLEGKEKATSTQVNEVLQQAQNAGTVTTPESPKDGKRGRGRPKKNTEDKSTTPKINDGFVNNIGATLDTIIEGCQQMGGRECNVILMGILRALGRNWAAADAKKRSSDRIGEALLAGLAPSFKTKFGFEVFGKTLEALQETSNPVASKLNRRVVHEKERWFDETGKVKG